MSQSGSYATSGGGASVNTLTGNTGGAVGPTGDNINIVGTGAISVAGNPGTSTLTISTSGATADSFPTDAGTAVPSAGVLNIDGGSNINTAGSGNTVTVNLDDTVSILGSMTAGTGLTTTTGDVTITAGNLNLPLTSSGFTEGTINFGGSPSFYLYNGGLYVGAGAGNSTTAGINNTVVGDSSAPSITGGSNTFVGRQSALSLTSGSQNTGIGTFSLSGLASGARNVCVGYNSGAIYNGTESDNICISTLGVSGDNATIRLGTPATHTSSFMAGAYGVTPSSSPEMMTIGSDGELGSQAIPGGGGISTLDGDTGSATGSTVTIAGGSNITTSATGSTVTVDLDSTVSIGGSMTAGTGLTTTTGDVTITAGNLIFPNSSTSTAAMITRGGGTRLLSFYGSGNTFLGSNAGNTTLVGATSNTAMGEGSLTNLTSGDENTGIGLGAGSNITTATGNTCLGYLAGSNVITGSSNTLIGHSAGTNYLSSEQNNICLGNSVTGTVSESNVIRIGNTSTNTSFFAAGVQGVTPSGTQNVVLINGSGQLGSSAGTNGQVLIGSTGASPAWATVTAGSGISVTNGANSITIASSGGGMAWSEQTGTTQAMAVNTGYILNNAGVVTATLPTTAAVGDVMEIVGKGAGGWLMAQNSGQTVHFGNQNTTTGVGGSLASTNRYDAICLVCITANTDFVVKSSVGNLTVV